MTDRHINFLIKLGFADKAGNEFSTIKYPSLLKVAFQ
jgi:hypothetical protein